MPGTLEHDLHLAILACHRPGCDHADRDLCPAAGRIEAARVALVEKLNAFAWGQARKWWLRTGKGELEDYRSAAQLGLWEAVRRFQPERGHKYATYAGWWLIRYLRPVAQAEAAAGFHVPGDHGFVSLNPVSADAEFPGDGDDGGVTFAATLPDHREADPREAPPNAADVWAAAARVLAHWPRAVTVLQAVYRDGLTLEATGKLVGGVSRERVRQILARAVARLRDHGKAFEGFLEGAA